MSGGLLGSITAKWEQTRMAGRRPGTGQLLSGRLFKQMLLSGFGRMRRAGLKGGRLRGCCEWLQESCQPGILPSRMSLIWFEAFLPIKMRRHLARPIPEVSINQGYFHLPQRGSPVLFA